MPEPGKRIIGIIPDVRGVGGPASFHQKFVSGLQKQEVQVSYDLTRNDLDAVLVIAGSRHLRLLRDVRRRGIPIIQRLDGMNWIHRQRYTGVKHYLRSEINNWILHTIRTDLADRIIYQSRFSQEWWFRRYGEVQKPAAVIYNGIDLRSYRPPFAVPSMADGIHLLAVEGHLKNGGEMGLRNALSALQRWQEFRGIPIELSVAGDVPDRVRKAMEPFLPGRLHWLGVLPREQIPERMQTSHAFFSLELNPACPNAVIEALACGLPIVAFDSGAIRELVDHTCGVILPYHTDVWKLQLADGSQLSFMGNKMLEDLAGFRQHARCRAEQMFDLDEMVRAYLDVILK